MRGDSFARNLLEFVVKISRKNPHEETPGEFISYRARNSLTGWKENVDSSIELGDPPVGKILWLEDYDRE